MSKECKCEHWQQCPVCMPNRFDKNGHLLPPEPTPLQAARIRIEELERERDTAWAQAHRLALELECLIMDTKDNAVVSKWWDSAFEAIEEYQALQADNAELVAALESVEWTRLGEMPEGKHCCYCGALEKHGHVTGCKVATSLKRTTLAQALSKLRKVGI